MNSPSEPAPKSTERGKTSCLFRSVRAFVLLYLIICGLLMFFEESLIFPAPRYPQGNWSPQLPFEDVNFSSADGTQLHGWFFEHESPKGYLLYSHGNGDFVPNLASYAHILRERFGYSVFIYDYRGYGKSAGSPNEAGVLADGAAAQQWLADRGGIGVADVVLMGRSLGGGVAVDLAANYGARALIVESTFSSMTDTAAKLYPFVPVRLLLRTRLNSAEKITRYQGPFFQSHGDADQLIPIELGRKLHTATPGPKQFYVISGGGHNDPQPEEYYQLLGRFLDSL